MKITMSYHFKFNRLLISRVNKPTRLILIVQAVCMLMGTSTHLAWVIQNGFLSEKYNASLLSTLFWDSLTFLDPLAAILLVFKPKIGLYLTLLIIVTDVIHNNLFYIEVLYFNSLNLLDWIEQYWMILGQVIFLLFVCLTLKMNLKQVKLAA